MALEEQASIIIFIDNITNFLTIYTCITIPCHSKEEQEPMENAGL